MVKKRQNGLTYADSGVDIDAGNTMVDQIKPLVRSTRRPGADAEIGGFGGLFDLKAAGFKDPILVAANDGVGTKVKIAIETGIHHTIGIDLVAMCVNDLVVQGAEPLFFLDYFATGKLEPHIGAEIIKGIAKGCIESGCALIGGETAEMPGFYPAGRYDLAGFCVAVVEEDERIDGQAVRAGDRIVAIASSGVHSNGFSLVRRILASQGITAHTRLAPEEPPLIERLLTPTTLYGELVRRLRQAGAPLHGMAHITGGGLPENLPRALPEGLHAAIDPHSWERPDLFRWLQEAGEVPEEDLWNTFNLGVGFCLVLPADAVEEALAISRALELPAWELGQVVAGALPGKPLAGLPY